MPLNKTDHLGLTVFPQSEEATILVRDVLRAIAEDSQLSNMHILDEAIYNLQKKNINDVVWSESQPESQNSGDTWNEILAE